MAKITPSALITEIRGKWHGDTIQMWKGAIVSRNTPHPRQQPTESRAHYKGYVSDVAGRYDALSDAQKTGWLCYADLLPTQQTGFNAFLGRNVTALTANHPGLCYYEDAPTTFSPPESPAPICVDYITATDSSCISWTTPSNPNLYVQTFHAPQAGYSNLKSPSWRLTQTVAAAQLSLSLDGSPFPAGTVIRFRARTLNSYAEPSPWTETKSAIKS